MEAKNLISYKPTRLYVTSTATPLNTKKTLTLSEKVANSKGDSKKLYALVSELTGTQSENPMPSGTSDSTLSDNFDDYFLNLNL